MKSILVEEGREGKKAYESIVLDPKHLSILNNELTLKIVQSLVKEPACALDIARELGIHEQKVYYHIRKLDKAGIIKPLRTEKRFGMTAKIYDVVSPVVSSKLYEDGINLKDGSVQDLELLKFLSPFLKGGKLDALMVMGDTYEHGKYDSYATEGPHAADFALLVGNLISGKLTFPFYKLDTEITKEDLKRNLILIGNPKSNVIIDKVNHALPIEFNLKNNSITSKKTGKKFNDPRIGLIAKFPNPFNPEKMILLLGGIRTRGTQSAIIAITRQYKDIAAKEPSRSFLRIVMGMDKSGHKIIDWIKVVE